MRGLEFDHRMTHADKRPCRAFEPGVVREHAFDSPDSDLNCARGFFQLQLILHCVGDGAAHHATTITEAIAVVLYFVEEGDFVQLDRHQGDRVREGESDAITCTCIAGERLSQESLSAFHSISNATFTLLFCHT